MSLKPRFIITLLVILGSCNCKQKKNEDVFAVGIYGWRHNLSVGEKWTIRQDKPSGFLMIYHDSVFRIEIDSTGLPTYFAGEFPSERDAQHYVEKYRDRILNHKQPKPGSDDYGIWGCAPPMYFLNVTEKKEQFGMCDAESEFRLYCRLGKSTKTVRKKVPDVVIRYYHQLNSMRSEFERSNEYPYTPMIEVTEPIQFGPK